MIRKMILAMFGAFVVGTASAAQIDFGDVPATQPVLDSADPFGFGYKFTINGTDYYWTNQPSITITAASLGALTAEADPVAGPRLTLIEAQTNNWRQAWTWGNHADAGYLAATAWQSWLSTNTYVRAELDQAALAALAQYAATNRVSMFRDTADPDVWWVANGGTNLSSWTLSDSVFYYEADQLAGFIQLSSGPFPYMVEGQEEGYFDGGLAYLSINGAGLWSSTSPIFPQALVNESYPGTTAFVHRAEELVASFNLTTGNVWQAVGEAKGAADAAQLAADQAGTLINYHTALDAAPHAGKFVTPGQLTNALEAAKTIVQPIRMASTNIVISSTNAVYYVALTNAANIGVDVSALDLGGTNYMTATVIIKCLTTQALYSVINTNSVSMDCAWEPTVTGRYEIAVSSDGVRTTARQVWPSSCGWATSQWKANSYDVVGTWTEIGSSGATNCAFFAGNDSLGPMCVRCSIDWQANAMAGTAFIMSMNQGNASFDFGQVVAIKTMEYSSAGTVTRFSGIVSTPFYGVWWAGNGHLRLYYPRQQSRSLNALERSAYNAGSYPAAFRLDY